MGVGYSPLYIILLTLAYTHLISTNANYAMVLKIK